MRSEYLDLDDDNVVINGEGTYQEVAGTLWWDKSAIFPWTDGEGTQLDVLMAFGPQQHGELQGGMHAGTDVFVAIGRVGMFGFSVTDETRTPDYVAEKLNLHDFSPAAQKGMTRLINGVIKGLMK